MIAGLFSVDPVFKYAAWPEYAGLRSIAQITERLREEPEQEVPAAPRAVQGKVEEKVAS